MYNTYYIESAPLNGFFESLKKSFRVFSPVVKSPQGKEIDYIYQQSQPKGAMLFNPYRVVEPLKSFFTYPYENVADYFSLEKDIADIKEKVIVFGVKNCDLVGHKIQDFVFLEGVQVDPLYRVKRENTFIVSGDCTDFKEVCHCLAWEILPYPNVGFDLNFSPLNDGYIIEAGSKKGEELLQSAAEFLVPVKETQLAARNAKRANLVDRLRRHLMPQNLVSRDNVQKLVKAGYSFDTWREFMLTCVECGGCNLICDTCHCFLLADKKTPAGNEKVRVWDSCLYANYARVAGGANPLKTRTQRLRNRFMKKFDFFVDNLGMPACCGCGRCIEVCPGGIDIREVLKDLAKRLNSAK